MSRWPVPLFLLTAGCATAPSVPSPATLAPTVQGVTTDGPGPAILAALTSPSAPNRGEDSESAERWAPAPQPASANEAQRLADARLGRLTTTATALDHPFTAAYFRAEIELLLGRSASAVAAIRPTDAWREQFVVAWTSLDRLEKAVSDGARHDGLMVTQGDDLTPGPSASDLPRSAP